MNGHKLGGAAVCGALENALGKCPVLKGWCRKEGVRHWVLQRLTAVALIPLGVWFALKVLSLTGASYAVALKALGSGFSILMLLILIPVLVAHLGLGVQAVIDDYIHDERVKRLSLKALRYTNLILIVAGILAVLRIALKS